MSETTFERTRRIFLSVAKRNCLETEVNEDTSIFDVFGTYSGVEFHWALQEEFKGEIPNEELVDSWIDQCDTLKELADFIDREKSK